MIAKTDWITDKAKEGSSTGVERHMGRAAVFDGDYCGKMSTDQKRSLHGNGILLKITEPPYDAPNGVYHMHTEKVPELTRMYITEPSVEMDAFLEKYYNDVEDDVDASG